MIVKIRSNNAHNRKRRYKRTTYNIMGLVENVFSIFFNPCDLAPAADDPSKEYKQQED